MGQAPSSDSSGGSHPHVTHKGPQATHTGHDSQPEQWSPTFQATASIVNTSGGCKETKSSLQKKDTENTDSALCHQLDQCVVLTEQIRESERRKRSKLKKKSSPRKGSGWQQGLGPAGICKQQNRSLGIRIRRNIPRGETRDANFRLDSKNQ